MTVYSKPSVPLGVERFERRGRRSIPVHYEPYANMGSCSICIAPISTWKTLMELPCGHTFHWGCMARYGITRLVAGDTMFHCPMCRRPLTVRIRTEREVGVAGPPPYTLFCVEDAFANAHTYALEDGTGTRYAAVNITDARPRVLALLAPKYRVATVRVHPWGGWVAMRKAAGIERV